MRRMLGDGDARPNDLVRTGPATLAESASRSCRRHRPKDSGELDVVAPEKSEDEIIRGTERDPTLRAVPDAA